MTTSLSAPPRPDSRATGNGRTGPRLRPAPRPRSMPWVALGVLIVVGCALSFAVAATHLGSRQPVLVVAKAVPAGGVIRSDTLEVVRVSTDSALRPLPGSSFASVIGRTAAVPLAAGTLLTQSELGPSVGLGAGQAEVGLALKSGQYPPDLAAGQTVRVVDVGGSGAASSGTGTSSAAIAGQVVVFSATVTSVGQPSATAATDTAVIGLLVPDGQAGQVAALAGANRVALVEVAPRQ